MQVFNQTKQFFLLNLKSIVDLYQNLFVIAWPMFISMAVVAAVVGIVIYLFFGFQESISSLLIVCGFFLFRTSIVLARLSVEKKSMRTVLQASTFSIFTLPILMLSAGIVVYKFLLQQPMFSCFFTNPLDFKTLVMLPFYPLHIFSFTVFYVLFMLDTNRTVQQIVPSVIRAVKIIFYNFPMYLTLFILFYYLVTPLIVLISNAYIRVMLLVFLCPVPIAVLSNLYITWTHKNYSRYFG